MLRQLSWILALAVVILVGWYVGSEKSQNSPQVAILSPQVALEDSLLVNRNSLVGVSYLPIVPEIRAELISEPIDYCGVAWLSNFWPIDLVYDASKICVEESHGQTWRVNENWFGVPELSCGIFQINQLAHPEYLCEEMKDPVKNVLAAIKIYENEGWGAWKNSAKKAGINY